ncbi:MAG: ABC transporter permease [Candidatus Izemoplasmatales bacterium]|nr:ABC transporter permease [Candidatus Izemoplasmatales bacterium]
MDKLFHLIKGEIFRLFKYKIFFFGILVSVIWVIILGLSDKATAESLAPSLVLMDAGLMSIILLASSFFLEKQEGTLHALLVSPVSLSKVLIAKIVSAIFMGLISFILVIGCVMIVHGSKVNVFYLLFYTIIVILAHTSIGYVLILRAKDFMALLVACMGVILLFMSPLLLMALDIVPSSLEFLVFLSPTYAGQVLVQSQFQMVDSSKIILSIAYLILIPAILYPLVVYKRFEKVAIEG